MFSSSIPQAIGRRSRDVEWEGNPREVELKDTVVGGAVGLDADPALPVQVGDDVGRVVQLCVLQGRQPLVPQPPVQLKVVTEQVADLPLAAGRPVHLQGSTHALTVGRQAIYFVVLNSNFID